MLELNNISKEYDKRLVLKDVNLSFPKNNFVCIVGPSGCGKTTLLNIIGGLDLANGGHVIYNKKEINKFSEKQLDSYRNLNIGFIFQNYNLINNLTVYENVEMPLLLLELSKKARRIKIHNILKKLGIEIYKNKKPLQLSGGEQQRVAIARALVNDPNIILADEPTGALDSKTALEIMDLIKAISINKLVIMVTHNERLATTYADRIINMQDGKIFSDKELNQDKKDTHQLKETKKFKGLLLRGIKISLRNLQTKKIRSLLTILAGSIGIMGLSLVLFFSNIINNYITDIQKNTLSNYPITIYSVVDNTNPYEENPNYEAYPDDGIINVVNDMASYYGHVNRFDENFLNYLGKMDTSWYNLIDYKTGVDLKIITQKAGTYMKVNQYRFTEMSDDVDYLKTQYELIAGDFPEDKTDLMLVVDRYNNIDAAILSYLGIEYEGISNYTFDELNAKEYKLILNDDYYQKINGLYVSSSYSNYQNLYENSDITLRIKGIIRPAKGGNISLYSSGVLYSSKLTDFVVSSANESDIVKEQKGYGLTKDVRTGLPFVDYISVFSRTTKEYQYESWLGELSAHPEISTIKIYTDTFNKRVQINNYLQAYNNGDDNIEYYDYMGDITNEFNTFILILTRVLIVFSSIALLVASIMTGVIMYVSVVERTKEIGIFRSVGFRRIDISNIFNLETGLMGFVSGIIGVISSVILLKPIITFISKILQENNVQTFDLSLLDLNKFRIEHLLIVVFGSVLLSIISGLIPALIAAHKDPVKALRSE